MDGEGEGTVEEARHKAAAQKGQDQGAELALGERVLPDQSGEKHDNAWGCIEQDRRHGQGGDLLAAVIQQVHAQHAAHAHEGQEGQLPQADAEGRAVRQKKEQRQQRRTAEITQDHDGQGGHP